MVIFPPSSCLFFQSSIGWYFSVNKSGDSVLPENPLKGYFASLTDYELFPILPIWVVRVCPSPSPIWTKKVVPLNQVNILTLIASWFWWKSLKKINRPFYTIFMVKTFKKLGFDNIKKLEKLCKFFFWYQICFIL